MFSTDRSRAVLALLVASFVFGATFVVIKSAVEQVPPLTFVAWRFLLGAAVLALFALPRGKAIWWHGTVAGIALFSGYAFQTAGLTETSASNSALITGLYVVITPFLAALFARRGPSWWSAGGAALAFAGLVLLTGTGGLSFERGDLLTLACAFSFALHIVALSRLARHHPVVPFTTVQLTVTAALAFPAALLVEGPVLPPSSVWGPLVLTGLGASAGCFVLQIWAQTIVGATTAAVVLAAEPAFAVATAWMVLSERLTLAGWAGAGLILLAIYIVVTRQGDRSSVEAEAVTPAH
ncbi:MAG TPA: DMT family transporter [Acidimicrobiia bacterium]|nr:DMT family transporter [Acidimicrobiia bacterium]